MRKLVLLFAIACAIPLYAAGPDLTAPEKITGAAQSGIFLNMSQGILSITDAYVGISGISFRHLDPDKNGFEIPFDLRC